MLEMFRLETMAVFTESVESYGVICVNVSRELKGMKCGEKSTSLQI